MNKYVLSGFCVMLLGNTLLRAAREMSGNRWLFVASFCVSVVAFVLVVIGIFQTKPR